MKRYDLVCISVGALTAKEAKVLMDAAKYNVLLYVFDPNPDVQEAYSKTFKDYANVIISSKAIGSQIGMHDFYLCGQSSSLKSDRECDKIQVEVIPLTYVIDTFVNQSCANKKILLMNCEGSEIDIINNTPLEALETFDIINVEFHHHVSSESDIQSCINKLTIKFNESTTYGTVSKNPRYRFERI